jgi:uncharacterized cupin superfamily protein
MMKKRKPTESEIKETESWGTWNKEPSEFSWYYDQKETCYILEGNATVTANDGSTLTFEQGDYVEFEPGLRCTWKIDQAIRKKFMFS